jgi:hypothetical protein
MPGKMCRRVGAVRELSHLTRIFERQTAAIIYPLSQRTANGAPPNAAERRTLNAER